MLAHTEHYRSARSQSANADRSGGVHAGALWHGVRQLV